MKNLYCLDTNVILYDPYILTSFKKNDVLIPLAVLEELDKFKKGTDAVNLASRTFIRNLNKLQQKTTNTLILNKGKIKTTVELYTGEEAHLPNALDPAKNDNKILACVLKKTQDNAVATQNKYDKVILVTNDIALRVKAAALGIPVEEYEIEQKHSSRLYQGFRTISISNNFAIDEIFKHKKILAASLSISDPLPNEYFIIKNEQLSTSAIVKYDVTDKCLHILKPESVLNISSKNVQQSFALNALLDPNIPLVTLTGAPGSGKTLLAIVTALKQLAYYQKIQICKTTLPMGRDIGFLPGDLQEKMSPHLAPFYDNISFLQEQNPNNKNITNTELENRVQIAALSYIRGRSLNSFFILDEAQNATPHELKTMITRMGSKSKLVLLGDIGQIDAPYLNTYSNGLTYVINRFKGSKLYAHVNLIKSERSELAEIANELL